MKMAKKVLSVVLSVLMALSCFAVAASAWGNEESTRNVTVTLQLAKTEDGAGPTWTVSGSKVTCSTPSTDDMTFASGTNIEAKPGETVWVYEKVATDYYVWGYGAQVFYSADLIDALTEFKTQTSKSSMTAAQEMLVHQWNSANEVVSSYGTASTAQAPWGKITAINNKNVAKAWPTDSSGTILAAYADSTGKAADLTKWAWARHNINMNPSAEAGLVWSGEDWLFRFPVKVPATATAGTIYTLTIPDEGMVQCATKSTSVMYCSEMGNEGVVDGENELEPVWKYPTSATEGSQHWDLSGATVTITVAEDEPEGLNYDDLNTAITNAKAKDTTNALSGATELAAEIVKAEALVDNATTQEEIDNEVTALNAAVAAVKYKASYTALDDAIALAGTKTAKDYTEASYNEMIAKLDAANAILRNQDTSYQDTIDEAAEALNTAITNLVAEGAANKDALNLAIETAEGLVEANYTETSFAGIAGPLKVAKDLQADTTLNAKDQTSIDTATNNLNDAIGALVEADADYKALNDLLEEIAELTEADYTPGSWDVLEEAVEHANGIDKNLKKKDQNTIDEEVGALTTAKNSLVEIGNASYTDLDAAIADIPDYPESYYTDDTWSAYATALDAANKVSRTLKATEQTTVDTATNKLVTAKGALALKDANYDAVNEAKNRIDPTSEEAIALYTPESLTAFVNACNAVVEGKKINEQTVVDGYADAINAVVLEYKAATTKPLEDAITAARALNASNYDESSYQGLMDLVTDAESYLEGTLDVRNNEEIQNKADAINNYKLVMLDANYDALDAAIADTPDYDQSCYTEDTWSAYATALDAANKVARDLKITDQVTVVDVATTNLVNAKSGLVLADADYKCVDDAKATIPTVLTKSYTSKIDKQKYTFNVYTDASIAAVNKAVDDVIEGKKANEQSIVNGYADAITEAVSELAYASLDLTYANTYYNPVNAAKDTYTETSFNTFKNAYDALATKSMSSWTDCGKALTAFDNAYLALEEAPSISYTDLAAYVAEVEGTDLTNAIEGVADFTELLGMAQDMVRNENAETQLEVDELLASLQNAFNALKYKAANYNALIIALTDYLFDMDPSEYTEASWSVYNEKINAGWNVPENLTTEDQQTIDAAVEAIEIAKEALKYIASYTALDQAIEAAADYTDSSLYTTKSWDAFTNALTAANGVNRDLDVSAQTTIDTAEGNLTSAIQGLELKASYTALDQAIEAAAAYTDSSIYTDKSWNAFTKALDAANNVDRNLGVNDQTTIDEAEEALTAAIQGLTEKTPEDELGHAKNVTFTPAKGNTNTYDVKVEGRAMMVQFYEMETGSTNSYDRYSTSKVTITSYNAAGEVVDSRNIREIAYEIWSVNTIMGEGEIKVRAKGNGETRWESLDSNLLTFENVRVAPDANLVSVVADESGKLGSFPMTITVGPDAKRVQVKMSDGSTNTTSALTDDGNGNLTCTIKGYANAEGENVITIRVLTDYAGWQTVGTFTYTASK